MLRYLFAIRAVDRNVAAGSSADSTYHPLTGNYLIKEEPV